VAQVQATIENVPQNPGTAFTVSGNTITFDGAPPSGTNNIYVYYTSPITQVIQPGQGTVGTAQIQSGVTVSFADGSAAAPSITNDGDTNTGVFFPAADTIAFAEGGVESMRINSVGNVGIGTTSPTEKLTVSLGSTGVGTSAIFNTLDGTYNTSLQIRHTVNGIELLNSNPFTGAYNNLIFSNTSVGETMRITDGGVLRFNSGYGSVATAFCCRAWVNFNGTGTIAIRASGNVSSLTDNGQGDYTVNFTSSMPDANYSVGGVTSKNANTNTGVFISSQATSNVRVLASVTDGLFDQPTVCVNIFR
jgi:hypothetical protein